MDIKISFLGDILFTPAQVSFLDSRATTDYISTKLKRQLQSSNLVIGNLETPITAKKVVKTDKFSFVADKKFLDCLADSNITMVSTANNHCLDNGIAGVTETIENLRKKKIDSFGTYKDKKDKKICIKQIGDTKISFLSYTYGTNAFINHEYLSSEDSYAVNLFKKQETSRMFLRKIKWKLCPNFQLFNFIRDRKYLNKVKTEILQAKKKSDIVIVAMHSGGQYNKKIDNYTRCLAHFLVNSGADVVVGNHPHRILETELYKDKFIAYSLGNFFAMPYENANQDDDFPNYSAILNLYINNHSKKIEQVTFNIAKTECNEELIVDLVDNVETNAYAKNAVEIFCGKNAAKIKDGELLIK
ncbi:CapA family protein [Candidatus Saccharibacteria bacterium]|nr:CapA family protein [Candidatus Saccharibacteria bacterium]